MISIFESMLKLFGTLAVTCLCLSSLAAWAGPPFQTDDPDPVPYQHYEVYLFELSDGTPSGGTTLEAPSVEANWGAVPNLQIHLLVPIEAVYPPENQGSMAFGIGDLEFGTKYRLVRETRNMPEIGIFPAIEFPTGDVKRGLGVGRTWFRLPVWIQKSWGTWTTYGGGGEVLVDANGFNNYPFAGWLLQKQLSDSFALGGELYGHGGEGSLATSTESSVMLDLGGIYSFSPVFQLLCGAGRAIAGQTETYTYFSLYWTWGTSASQNAETVVPRGLAMLSSPTN